MASNYTSNYNLCQWEATDQVLRTDFNEDNAKVDSALKGLATQLGTKATQSALNAVAATIPKIAVGIYQGDGVNGRIINVGFTPKAVFLGPSWGATCYYSSSSYDYTGGLFVQGGPLTGSYSRTDIIVAEIVTGGFKLYFHEEYAHRVHVNHAAYSYRYLAIG